MNKTEFTGGWSLWQLADERGESTVLFCLFLCPWKTANRNIHRRLSAASCFGGATWAAVTWEGRVFSCSNANTRAYQQLDSKKNLLGLVPRDDMHLQQASRWVLPSLKPKKHWLKLSDYLLKVNSHFWINLFCKFRFLNINFLPANLNF